ncbi:MAG: hypothetical protein JWM11_1306 [Planctomycetaceae bacterium]|nr:hypothetical protein [Planctomycetaceae bacterium]
MWCAKCQSEVAVEARPNSQRLHCATCGTEITARLNQPAPPPVGSGNQAPSQNVAGAKASPPGRNPQELLARWASSQMFDPYGPIVTPGSKPPETRPDVPKSSVPAPAPLEVPAAPAAVSKSTPVPDTRRPAINSSETLDKSAKVRVDPAFTEGWSDVPTPHVPTPPHRDLPSSTKVSDRQLLSGVRAHSPSGLRGPHFDPSRLQAPPPKSFKFAAVMGHFLAYVGAATLTGGAGLVLWGYLGGPTNLAPTGWFTSTVGQMLLFMGVVTLVSAGMEQTTVEVSRRVDAIGEKLTRLEYATAQAASAAADAEIEAQLRAEIAELRNQLANRKSS